MGSCFSRRARRTGRFLRPLVLLVFLGLASGLAAEEDLRDSRARFFDWSLGLFGHFDRIHVRDFTTPDRRVNSILTCMGWGVFADSGWFSARAGLRSQLGTSSLDPGYADDEQLVATFELQAKYPLFWDRLVKVYPSLSLEAGRLLSGTLRDGESYYPFLVKVGAGADVEICREVYLRFEAAGAVNPAAAPGFGPRSLTTFATVAQMVGYRFW